VSQCGPRWWVKISDFGISKRIEETSLRTIIGSEGYIAPEVRGFFTPDDDDDDDSNDDNETGNGARKSVSLAVDIWAVGAVTFRITTGRVAFQAARDLAKYVSSKRPFPFPIDSTMSSDLTLFLLETMRASPHERPAVQLALAHPWLQTQPPDLPETHFQPNPVTTTSSDGYFARWTTEISSVSSNKTEYVSVPLPLVFDVI
jgi:serine/threonine protein kinase